MNKLRVLHIVPWFPNSKNKIEAIFIVEHIKALNKHCHNEVLHISFGKKSYQSTYFHEGIKVIRINIGLLFDKWRIKELKAHKKIDNFLRKYQNNFDIINFQIAYPNAIGINKLHNKYQSLKFVITEHWTAYHYGFDLPKGHKGRERIENIFNNNILLLVVSNALGIDIQNFTNKPNRKFSVIPNVIDCNSYKFTPKKTQDKDFVFASINNWNPMKNPFVLIKAFELMAKKYTNVKLILGGTGKTIPEMKTLVSTTGLNEFIKFTGRLTKQEVVSTLKEANVYCQSSNYETFSVICAEALITGTPVIATNIGGIKDFITAKNGTLVDDMNVENWFLAMEKTYLNYDLIDNRKISRNCSDKFNSNVIGKLYYSQLTTLM